MAISSEEACNAVRQRRRGEEQPLRVLKPGAKQERTHHRDPSREAVRSDPATVREGPGVPELGPASPSGACAKLGRARTMPSTTIYRRAQVVVVEVPFSDLSGRIAKEDL